MIQLKDLSHKLILNVYYIPNLRSNISLMKEQNIWLRDRNPNFIDTVSMTKNRMFLIKLQIVGPICLKTCVEDGGGI